MTKMKRLALAALVLCTAAGAAQAQRVVRDAVTGELRAPTAAEAAQLEALSAAKRTRVPRGLLTGTPNPKPIRLADGSDFLEATDADLNYSVVMVGKDGQLVRQCVGSAEMAERIVQGRVTAFAKNPLER